MYLSCEYMGCVCVRCVCKSTEAREGIGSPEARGSDLQWVLGTKLWSSVSDQPLWFVFFNTLHYIYLFNVTLVKVLR